MIFAAGLGTRLRPLTDHCPKALVRVGEQPLLWYVVTRLRAAGYERIVINVHHLGQQVIDYVERQHHFGIDIRISDERQALLDTGGGIRKALDLLDNSQPVLIHNVDILSNVDLALIDRQMSAPQSACDALLVVSPRHTKRYLLFDADARLKGWTNVDTGEVRGPAAAMDTAVLTPLAFAGIHVLSPAAYPLLRLMPSRFPIIDFYLRYCHQLAIVGHHQAGFQLLDVGKLYTLEEAEHFVKRL